MKFGPISTPDATGHVLAHSLIAGNLRLPKGHTLTENDTRDLVKHGVLTVTVAQLDATDIGENPAAAQLATAFSGQNIRLTEPFSGRVNLIAKSAGVLRVKAANIAAFNGIDEAITIATLPDYARIHEGTLLATRVHLSTSTAEDSKSGKKYNDCRQTLEELNQGDLLHEVQIVIAVAAPDRENLKRACDDIISRTKPFFKLRHDVGMQQANAAKFFSDTPSKYIGNDDSTWQMTSREAALMFGPVGFRKLSNLDGTMRGQSADGAFPFFFNSWPEGKKIATHEIVVGITGAGKTFSTNCFLARQYLEQGVPFDLLEPMGHGHIVAEALGAPLFVPSPNTTNLNPLDIMYPDVTEQITHVIRLVETMLGRQFSGSQEGNHQKALIGQALVMLYGIDKNVDLFSITAAETPLLEDLCTVLASIQAKPHIQAIARDIADEIGGLCTGSGPYARFVNARTNLDLSFRGKATPRIFSFHEMSSDPELLAIAYTQVLTAIRRDSLADDNPRTIVVDEVYRLMRHPSLLDFLVEAVKTFRTRRKKVIVIDQQMRVFLSSEKAKLLFENCPIRVIFNQRNGMDVFQEHVAFQHLTEQHLETISSLRRGHYILDIQDQGIYFLNFVPSMGEIQRFGSS